MKIGRGLGTMLAGASRRVRHLGDRLAEDHTNAKRLAEAIAKMPNLDIDPSSVETNIVYFEVAAARGGAKRMCDQLHAEGVWMLPVAEQRVRAVTHLDVSADAIDRAVTALRAIAQSAA